MTSQRRRVAHDAVPELISEEYGHMRDFRTAKREQLAQLKDALYALRRHSAWLPPHAFKSLEQIHTLIGDINWEFSVDNWGK